MVIDVFYRVKVGCGPDPQPLQEPARSVVPLAYQHRKRRPARPLHIVRGNGPAVGRHKWKVPARNDFDTDFDLAKPDHGKRRVLPGMVVTGQATVWFGLCRVLGRSTTAAGPQAVLLH
ncbi:MAG: hypothetical protein FJX25_10340 [Alphaproteobacteria bacterium]|nr:hypothetical protein [Alphaproteobacteria bacterium]